MPLSKAQERKLNQLERKYDKASEPTRTFYTDKKDIETLVKEGAIDIDHGLLLLDNAKAHYTAVEAARKAKGKPKRVLTPIGTLLRPKAPLRPINAIAQAHGAFSQALGNLFCLGATVGLAWLIF